MRDISGAYQRANKGLLGGWKRALSALPETEPPPIDELWESTTVGDLRRLQQRFGTKPVAGWVEQMWRREHGQ